MPLFSGPSLFKNRLSADRPWRHFWNQVDQPAPMEHIGKDECRLGAFLEVHLRASRKDGRDPGRSRLVWT